jgi:hypothetical protein
MLALVLLCVMLLSSVVCFAALYWIALTCEMM